MSEKQYLPNSFCHRCAASLANAIQTADGPQCLNCGFVIFLNVPSVAGLVIPVAPEHENGRMHGVYAVRRGIEPYTGQLALPSGFRIHNKYCHPTIEETWQETGCRESYEEIQVDCDPSYISHLLTESAHIPGTVGNRDLIIGQAHRVLAIKHFQESDEAQERTVIFPDSKEVLCFSIHRRALSMYWNSLYQKHNVLA